MHPDNLYSSVIKSRNNYFRLENIPATGMIRQRHLNRMPRRGFLSQPIQKLLGNSAKSAGKIHTAFRQPTPTPAASAPSSETLEDRHEKFPLTPANRGLKSGY